NSAPHRDLLLHPAFQELGTGYYDAAGADVPYWVTDFGRRSGVYPVIIDGEAATAVSRTVSLYVYGTGIWSEMRLRNNDGAWTGWQPFQSTLNWTLPNTAGEHAVWVEMRDTGSSTVSSDTIELTQSFLPTLGNVPDELAFTYDKAAGTVSPIIAQVTPANVGDSQNLTWTLSAEGTWFSLTPMNGTTPDTFSIAPQPSDLSTLPAGTYTGAVTVTVTDPADTQDTPQRIDLTVEVQAPALGGLPDSVTFNYYMPESLLLPESVTLTPGNTGSDGTINWTVSKVGSWFTASPTSGSTPGGSFTLTPSSFDPSTVQTYTGEVTVTATSPSGTENSPHPITVQLRVVDTGPGRIFLPTIMRFYTPPIPLRYPNDTYYSSQWGLAKMNAPLAWGSTLGDNVLIAVLDSGADFSHPDLQSKLRSDIDWDYVNDDGTAQDDNGHGTHVSGIAAAVTDNNQGVAGLGWNSTILPLKVLDNRGDGDLQALLDAIYDATDQGVKVINMSLGSDPTAQELVCEVDTPSLAEAFQYAYDHGVVSVVSAGNDDGYDAGRVVPASCPYVLTVGATTSSDTRASFSN
ncbi:MAG: S8 family serine peptidase, partial [Anaerolineae bacterium]